MSALERKMEKNPYPTEDLIMTILARVSRSYYANLSLVSKSFRSILASPELYQTRTLLGRTENFLYVCLRFPDEANPRWFTLYQKKPNQTLTKKKKKQTKKKKKKTKTKTAYLSVHLLAPTPILNSPPGEWSSLVNVGFNLYADSPCFNVWYLDCRTHTCFEAPRMRIAHTDRIYYGDVYLAGSSESADFLNCVEVYNTETQAWNPMPPKKLISESENMNGKIYFKLKAESASRTVVTTLPKCLYPVSCCTIGNIVFCYDCRGFVWRNFNCKGGIWTALEGLEGLPQFDNSSFVKLADYGGKLVVLWDKYLDSSGYKQKMIWCAEISLKKRSDKEIWGEVEWFDAVLTVPKSYTFMCAKSATV